HGRRRLPSPLRDALPIWGSNGKLELTGVKKLRELILSLAVRGKLVPQNSEGPSAASLLVDIEAKKKELYHAKIVKKPRKLCQPQDRKSTRLNSSHVKTSY